MSDQPHRPFRRTRRRRWIAGICAAFAERWGCSPGAVRLLFAAATVIPVIPGLPVYLLLWLLTPLEPPASGRPPASALPPVPPPAS